jgi:hypothetical protein
LFFSFIKKIIKNKKNKAVPKYAKKLVCGLGKNNKTKYPIITAKAIK